MRIEPATPRRALIILTLTAFVFRASAWAEDPNSLQTIDDYLQYALLNNAGVKADFERFKSAVEQVPQAKALEDPTFTYGYFVEEVETRVGPQRNRFSIMQKFPWFGVIEARTDAAAARAKAARRQYDAARLELFRKVKETFFEYAYLGTATDIAERNLELIKHFEEVARSKYRASTAAHPDIVRAQVELAKLEDVLKSLRELRSPTVARLNAALNRPADASLPWPQKPPPKQVVLEKEKIIELLIQSNPQLAALDWQTEAARANLALAKKRFYPNIGVGVDVIQTDNALMPNVRDSGKDPVILMFSVNIPLWHDSYKAGERQAQAELQKTQQQKVETENRIIAQTIRVLYDIEDAQRKVRLYGDILVAKAQELVEASESAYKAGNVDFLSLIDAQRMLLKYQLDCERALTDREQRIAELEMLVGQEL
jgi:cobalt-zinc-cadmium efflux system outer membrane protein